MSHGNLEQFILSNVNKGGYPIINESDYNFLINSYNKDDIINIFVEILSSNRNKNLIFKEINDNSLYDKFVKLNNKKNELIKPDSHNIIMKHDYKFNIGNCLGVVQLGHYYNDISNYFQQLNRMKCGGYNRVSPYSIWNGNGLELNEWKKLLKGFISPLFRSVNNKKRITEQEYRFCFRLSSTVYTATQFRPEVAKTIIEKFSNNGRVIDLSMGWGDRLAGFFTSNNGSYYIGTDPNKDVFLNYYKQINYYKNNGNNSNKIVEMFNEPSEDCNWDGFADFDLLFTSPPYFNTELYAKNSSFETKQSWYRYDNYNQWRDNYLFKSIDNALPVLSSNAIIALNIINIGNGKKTLPICEELYDFLLKKDFNYLGYVGLRMKQRPKNINKNKNTDYMNSYYVEPIWIFKKK